MRTAWPIARPFSPMSLRASAPRAVAISPAMAWYSMLTSLCGLAPSMAVDALTPRYMVAIGAREPGWGALLNMSDSLLASRPCLSTREEESLLSQRLDLSATGRVGRAGRGPAWVLLFCEP